MLLWKSISFSFMVSYSLNVTQIKLFFKFSKFGNRFAFQCCSKTSTLLFPILWKFIKRKFPSSQNTAIFEKVILNTSGGGLSDCFSVLQVALF